ncbi:MAG: hypothetical protein ACXADL_02675 [Candidatus Thorarchaeota archaeon]
MRDKKIQKIDSDIQKFMVERQRAEAELQGIGPRLDGEIERLSMISKEKKAVYESLRAKTQVAEKIWRAAEKDFKQAEGRKGKEISEVRKRADKLVKRTRDAQKIRDKRIRELDKEKEKQIEKAKREKDKELQKMRAREIHKVEEEKRRELGMD